MVHRSRYKSALLLYFLIRKSRARVVAALGVGADGIGAVGRGSVRLLMNVAEPRKQLEKRMDEAARKSQRLTMRNIKRSLWS